MATFQSFLLLAALSSIPYFALAWGYTKLSDGGAGDFWIALGVLIGVRLFFAIIEGLGRVLSYRIYGKRFMTQKLLEGMRLRKLPKRKFAEETFEEYLTRLDDDPQQTVAVKCAATEFRTNLDLSVFQGFLSGRRMHAATEAASDIYSPKAEAPRMYSTS